MSWGIAKTEYFKLGNMTILCLMTLENGYEILGSATRPLLTETDEEEARGIAHQRASYCLTELRATLPTVQQSADNKLTFYPPYNN